MTNTVWDTTHCSDLIFMCGSNPEHAHPVLGMQIREAVQNGTKLIVCDPRDIDLTKSADVHLKLKPGTNVAMVNGLMHVIIEEDLVDHEFIEQHTEVEQYKKLCELVAPYTPEKVGEICHLDPDKIREAARLYAAAKAAPIFYCLGVTEHSTGTEGVMSLSNLAMITGKIGRPGCGVCPVRGQNNVQGACDMGALPTDFPGYQKVANPDVVAKFEKAWGVELNKNVGTKATECFDKMISGDIKGLFIFGEDPVTSDPDTNHVMHALKSLDFFVIDELFMTETAKFADVILPGRSYLEKEGTFSASERRVQRIRKAIEIPGNTKLDTDIFIELMNRMGYPQPQLTSAEIMEEIASVTPSFGGISHARLDSAEVAGKGLQWPCPTADHPGTPILHKDGNFSRGKGTYYLAEYKPSREMPDEEYPIMLTTGRILYHYNNGAMTKRDEGINIIAPSSFAEINTKDAERAGIKDGDKVRVTSRRSSIETTARVSDKTGEGELWMPWHFLDGNPNWLCIGSEALDGIAKAPEYKVCAVKIAPAKEDDVKVDNYLEVKVLDETGCSECGCCAD